MTHQITFQPATVSQCDYIGRTVSGVQAIVTKDGVEVFRSKPHGKRFPCKRDAIAYIASVGGDVEVMRVNGSLRTQTKSVPAIEIERHLTSGWTL